MKREAEQILTSPFALVIKCLRDVRDTLHRSQVKALSERESEVLETSKSTTKQQS
jgi:hypothetical protein